MGNYIAGIDIGGTKCAVTLALSEGDSFPRIIAKSKFQTEKNAPQRVLEALKCALDGLLSENKLTYKDISGIGISCGGPLDAEKGVILSPPNLPGWDKIEAVKYFEGSTGIKTALENDANACAVAEWRYGAGKGSKNMVFLTFGTGLGAGIIANGKLYRGSSDNAGEIGHVRLEKDGPIGYGKAGSCEGFCSGNGIKQLGISEMKRLGTESSLYKACEGDESKLDAKLISELAEKGDETAIGIYARCGENLGRTLSVICDVLDPELIVLGGIFMRSEALLRPHIEAVMEKEALKPCRVVMAGLGESVGDYAAISVAPCNEVDDTEKLFARYPMLNKAKKEIIAARDAIISTYENGGKLLLCGNGGSAADCEHIAGELMKSFKLKRPIDESLAKRLSEYGESGEMLAGALEKGLVAISLCGHPALSTAYSNDREPKVVFAQQVNVLGEEGDMLIALTTSGNSENCLYAATVARAKGLKVLSVTGKGGGKIAALSDVCIALPEKETYLVQELTLPVYHYLCAEAEKRFFS